MIASQNIVIKLKMVREMFSRCWQCRHLCIMLHSIMRLYSGNILDTVLNGERLFCAITLDEHSDDS